MEKSVDTAARESRLVGLTENRRTSPEFFFETRLREIVRPGDRILDAGSGQGKFFSFTFAKQVGCRVTGVDICDGIALNHNLDVRVRADLGSLPFQKESFDVVNCRLVVEHLRAPQIVFGEFHRVLKPGGRLAIFTPNLFHYFGATANATPQWFHLWFNSQIRGFDSRDVFPTFYRANTRGCLKTRLAAAGFNQIDVLLVEGAPNVLAFDFILNALGKVYKRMVDRFEFLSAFRLNIIAISHKT